MLRCAGTKRESDVDRVLQPNVKARLLNVRDWRGFKNPWMPEPGGAAAYPLAAVCLAPLFVFLLSFYPIPSVRKHSRWGELVGGLVRAHGVRSSKAPARWPKGQMFEEGSPLIL